MTLNFGYRTPKAQLKFVACQTNFGNPSRSYISKKEKKSFKINTCSCDRISWWAVGDGSRVQDEDFLEKETNFFLHRL